MNGAKDRPIGKNILCGVYNDDCGSILTVSINNTAFTHIYEVLTTHKKLHLTKIDNLSKLMHANN
jgi:hypothetical protein